MSHENSQFDIPAIQLRESRTQPRVSLSREIGDAQITHTIFGKAKVRIIRKGDQARRNIILAAIVVAALAAAAWQGWFASQQTEQTQSTASAPAATAEAQAGLLTSQPENIVPPAIPPSVNNEPVAPPTTTVNVPAAKQGNAPQQPGDLPDAGQKTVKPVKDHPKPVTAKSKEISPEPMMAPRTAPVATSKDTLKNQADMPPPARGLPAKQPVTPAAAIPAQPAASSPVAVVPLGKEDVTIQSPVGDKQLSAPISAPGK